MKFNPVSQDIETLVVQLQHGMGRHVVLEPGDSTRYDLVITPTIHDKELCVTRLIGGDPVASILVHPHSGDYEFSKLANSNNWTWELLKWWFYGLMLKMGWMPLEAYDASVEVCDEC